MVKAKWRPARTRKWGWTVYVWYGLALLGLVLREPFFAVAALIMARLEEMDPS